MMLHVFSTAFHNLERHKTSHQLMRDYNIIPSWWCSTSWQQELRKTCSYPKHLLPYKLFWSNTTQYMNWKELYVRYNVTWSFFFTGCLSFFLFEFVEWKYCSTVYIWFGFFSSASEPEQGLSLIPACITTIRTVVDEWTLVLCILDTPIFHAIVLYWLGYSIKSDHAYLLSG